jgi:Family of unknown function (DUF6941)
MRATLLLADYAVVAQGKLTIVGGGWTLTGPNPQPFAIALKLDVPWHAALDPHVVRLELLDADGRPVLAPASDGEAPVRVEARLDPQQQEMPEPIKAGTPIDVALAFNFPPLPLPAGSRFEWRLTIDGESREDWFLAFSTRTAPETYG